MRTESQYCNACGKEFLTELLEQVRNIAGKCLACRQPEMIAAWDREMNARVAKRTARGLQDKDSW